MKNTTVLKGIPKAIGSVIIGVASVVSPNAQTPSANPSSPQAPSAPAGDTFSCTPWSTALPRNQAVYCAIAPRNIPYYFNDVTKPFLRNALSEISNGAEHLARGDAQMAAAAFNNAHQAILTGKTYETGSTDWVKALADKTSNNSVTPNDAQKALDQIRALQQEEKPIEWKSWKWLFLLAVPLPFLIASKFQSWFGDREPK